MIPAHLRPVEAVPAPAVVTPLICQVEAARFASTPADAERRITVALDHLAEDLRDATTHTARREALDTAATALMRVERASGRVGVARMFEVAS